MSETTVVTLLFTDLVGSTEISQRLGEDRAEAVRRQHTDALREAVSASGGREVKHLGDGLMVVFDSPSAAASCAIAMQINVDRQNRKLVEPLGLRVGLHTGEVTREKDDFFGTAVVVAERLCKRCEGGQIFASDVVRALVGTRGDRVFKEIGPLELKGISEPVHASELHWEPEITADALELARASFARQAWGDSFAQFSAADQESSLEPADVERLATAAHLLGKDEECVDIWARAHHEHLNSNDPRRAARCAFWLAFGLLLRGEMAPAGGWFARAGRLLEEIHEECAEQGYLLLPVAIQTMFGGDAAGALPTFLRAVEVGERFREPDLVALARLGQGQCQIMLGQTAQGVALLDEAMAAVAAGEVSPIPAGLAYCIMIDACQEIFDVRRAQEWTAALTRWCVSQPDLVPYRGQCLVHRAEIMQLRGAWPDAVSEAELACDRLSRPPGQAAVGMAFYALAELHRLRGGFAEAEEAYRKANEHGRTPQPGLSQLRLGQGQIDTAVASIGRALDEADVHGATRSRILPAYIETMLAAGDVSTARTGADELAGIAATLNVPFVHALSAQGTGAVLLAEGNAGAALAVLRDASTLWRELDVPYEAARTRVLIALASREIGDADSAEMELDAARRTFEELGAVPDIARVDALAGRSEEPTSAGGLTPREIEVLVLVATGKTNRAIAAELVLSEKTVARHLSNIFTKLGVSSRSAATAYAYEHDLV